VIALHLTAVALRDGRERRMQLVPIDLAGRQDIAA
jgi:hypothetical protein